MRKVLVCGAAFAATCIAAVSVHGGAEAAPPTPPPAPTSSALPGLDGGSQPPSTETPTPQPSATVEAADPVVSTRAVMVTPEKPKFATFAYGRHSRQSLDAYWKPLAEGEQRSAPGPAVLLFHGGSWIGGDKSSWKYVARRLTAKGFTVFSANYRLAHQAPWPAQRDDALGALTFVKRNSAKWNVDPNRIVAFGSSAGGLLADQLATYGEGAQRVRGAVSLSPVNSPLLAFQDGLKPDATASQHALRRAVLKLLGCVPVETDPTCLAQADDSNATTHASSGDAPLFLLHYKDEFVPPAQSTGLASTLQAMGVPATVKVFPGRNHAYALLNEETVLPAIIDWFKAQTS